MFAIAVQLHSLAWKKETREKALLCKFFSQEQNGKMLSIIRPHWNKQYLLYIK